MIHPLRIAGVAVVLLGLVSAPSASRGLDDDGAWLQVRTARGTLLVERGECAEVDTEVIREWTERAYRDLSAAWPARVESMRVDGLRMSGRRRPLANGKPAYGYWDRDRATIVYRCGTERVVRHELFHVWCERAKLPCNCLRIDHPGGFALDCSAKQP